MNEPSKEARREQRKKQRFEPYKVKIGGRTMWQVNLESETRQSPDGRRVRVRPRRTFSSVEEAREFATLKRIERKNRGTLAVSMRDSLRVAAIQAAEILSPFGDDARIDSLIVEAAREYAARRELAHKSETVANAVFSFLKNKESDQARPRYLQELRSRLGRFARDFAQHKVCDLSAAELDEWLRSLDQSPLSRNTYHLRLHTLLEYCRTRGWLSVNPLKDVPRAKIRQDGPIGT